MTRLVQQSIPLATPLRELALVAEAKWREKIKSHLYR
jgi:hypothetical protein